MAITLLVPTLNEIVGMREVMPRIRKEWVDQILVADGGSTDGSLEYAKEQGYEIVLQKKRGLMNAYRQAWPSIRGDILVTFSPDGNSIPEAIPELTHKIKDGYDLVIASRYLNAAKSEDDTFMTRLGNWVLTNGINLLFRAHYTDGLVIFRAYRTKVIEELGLLMNRSHTIEEWFEPLWGWELMSSIRAAKKGLRVAEVAASEPKRIGGKTKCQHYRQGFMALALMAEEWLLRDIPTTSQTHELETKVARDRVKR